MSYSRLTTPCQPVDYDLLPSLFSPLTTLKGVGPTVGALIAKVAVGQNPIGLTFIKKGAEIVVADSNKSRSVVSESDLAVVNTNNALAGKAALVGVISSGMQPREFDLLGGQTLLVSNTGSGLLEALTIGGIP